jgi:hypothetical protein
VRHDFSLTQLLKAGCVSLSRPTAAPWPHVVKPKLKDLKRRAIKINQSTVPEKNRETFNQQKQCLAIHKLCTAVILFGVFASLALLMYLPRPWEDNFAPWKASG